MISLRNNAQSVLTLPVSAEQTLLNLSLGDGGKFPDLSLGDSFRCAIKDSAGNVEFIRVVQRAGDILTVERGQEGTRARDWKVGARVQLRMTAKTWEEMAGEHWRRVMDASGLPITPTVVGPSSFSLPGDFVSLFAQTRSFRLYTGDGTFLYGYVANASLSGNATLIVVEGISLPSSVVAVDIGLPLNVHPKAVNAAPVAHLTDSAAHSAIIIPLRGDIDEVKQILSGLVRSDGTIDANMLPPATKKTLGGVIIGSGLKVSDAGLVQVDEAVFAKVPNAVWADGAQFALRLRREGNVDTVWNWIDPGGQPSHVWGGNDSVNMYVYNPANFSVNYANSSNYANSAGSAPANGGTAGAVSGVGVLSLKREHACVLPSGGTWVYFYFASYQTDRDGYSSSNHSCGTAAGGSTIASGTGYYSYSLKGIAIRIS